MWYLVNCRGVLSLYVGLCGYSITEMPLSLDDCKLLKKAIALLGDKENIGGDEIMKVLAKVRNRLTTILNYA